MPFSEGCRADDVWENRVPVERRVVVWVRKAAS